MRAVVGRVGAREPGPAGGSAARARWRTHAVGHRGSRGWLGAAESAGGVAHAATRMAAIDTVAHRAGSRFFTCLVHRAPQPPGRIIAEIIGWWGERLLSPPARGKPGPSGSSGDPRQATAGRTGTRVWRRGRARRSRRRPWRRDAVRRGSAPPRRGSRGHRGRLGAPGGWDRGTARDRRRGGGTVGRGLVHDRSRSPRIRRRASI